MLWAIYLSVKVVVFLLCRVREFTPLLTVSAPVREPRERVVYRGGGGGGDRLLLLLLRDNGPPSNDNQLLVAAWRLA